MGDKIIPTKRNKKRSAFIIKTKLYYFVSECIQQNDKIRSKWIHLFYQSLSNVWLCIKFRVYLISRMGYLKYISRVFIFASVFLIFRRYSSVKKCQSHLVSKRRPIFKKYYEETHLFGRHKLSFTKVAYYPTSPHLTPHPPPPSKIPSRPPPTWLHFT